MTDSTQLSIFSAGLVGPVQVASQPESPGSIQEVEPHLSTEEDREPIRRRQSARQLYIRSPSARNNRRHCKFCEKSVEGADLETHLKRKRRCLVLYMKFFKVSTFDHLALKLFTCEFCKLGKRMDFKKHLQRNQDCLAHYRRKYREEEINSIHTKVLKEKRRALPSRSSSTRTASYKKIKDEVLSSKTIASSLNEYRDKTAFGNYRLCLVCKSNYREYGARPISEEEFRFEFGSSEDMKVLRRFHTYFKCHKCSKEPVINNAPEVDCLRRLGESVAGDNITFFPLSDNEVNWKRGVLTESRIKLLFPKGFDSVTNLGVKKPKQIHQETMKMYRTSQVERETVNVVYQNELHKYAEAEKSKDLVCATVQNDGTNILENVEAVASASRITGSDDWFHINANRMRDRQEQCGLLHITLELELVPTSRKVIATALIQDGIPVTIDKVSLANGENQIMYMVHTSHTSEEDCSGYCEKLELGTYIENHNFDIGDLGNKYIGTYVSSCHQVMNTFTKVILEAPNSELFSVNYKLFLNFDQNGVGRIVGSFWPEKLNNVNADLAKNGGAFENNTELVEFIEKNVCCTANKILLRDILQITEEEAQDLSHLVFTHQMKFETGDDELSLVGMPSLETILIQCCSKNNFEASVKLIQFVKVKIFGLCAEEKKTMRTFHFLEDAWKECTGAISDDLETLELDFEANNKTVIVKFEVDERLTDFIRKYEASPLNAAYHYALSCVGCQDNSAVVLKRLWIIDCFIVPFNPLFLKANPPCMVQVVKDTKMFRDLLFKDRKNQIDGELFDRRLLFSHRLVSLEEALSLTDPKIKKINVSSTEQFVDAKSKRRMFFKKVYRNDEKNFKVIGSNERYQMLGNIIQRHFSRQSNDQILLAETAAWFDFVGEERSRELAETYKTLEIPRSEDEAICSGNKLPELIICKNKDVLKKRKKRKILILPECKSNYEFMYQKCLLFLPLQTESELTENLQQKYEKMNDDGTEKTVVMNERKFFEMKLIKATIETDIVESYNDRSQPTALDYLLEALEGNDEGEVDDD